MENFYNLIKIPTTAMNITRSNPYIDKNKTWFIQILFYYGILTTVFVLLIYNIVVYDLKINDFSQTCKNGVLCVVYIVITYQYYVLLYHGPIIIELIEDIKKDFELSIKLPIEERQVMSDYSKKGIWVCKQWLVMTSFGSNIFVIKNLFLYAYYYYIGELRLLPMYDLTYPDVIEKNKNNIIVYCLLYISMFFYACFSAVMYLAFVPLGPIFMLHACGQLELIKRRIMKIFDEHDDEVIMMKIRNIIQHLQHVYSFVERLNVCFKVIYELTMKGTTILLPLSCYEVIESLKRGEISVEFFTFVIGGILISSSPCFYSDLLMEKGEDVRLAVYYCGWERHYNRRVRTTLQLILLRALRPMAISTMFRTLCLDALTDLFQQSYTIFNLMNAMWSDN